ncbi:MULTISPECIES: hypothetical protein [Henriciella]|uniref:hypothetical protein n=1 Tax=Henriciella TaxID=453849 RepID=UPI0035113152
MKSWIKSLLLPAALLLTGCFEIEPKRSQQVLGFLQFAYGAPVAPFPSGLYRETAGEYYLIEQDLDARIAIYNIHRSDASGTPVTTGAKGDAAIIFKFRDLGHLMVHYGAEITLHWLIFHPDDKMIEVRELACDMLTMAQRDELGFDRHGDTCKPKDGANAALAALYAMQQFDSSKGKIWRLKPVSQVTAAPARPGLGTTESEEDTAPSSPPPLPSETVAAQKPAPDAVFLNILKGSTIYLNAPDASPPSWEEIELKEDGSLLTTTVWPEPDGNERSFKAGDGVWTMRGRRLCVTRIAGEDCFILSVSAGKLNATRPRNSRPAFTDIRSRPAKHPAKTLALPGLQDID